MPAWLIVVVILTALVGSVWWLLPSPAERRRGRLRAQAQAAGARVRFLEPAAQAVFTKVVGEGAGQGVAYQRPRQLRGKGPARVWLRAGDAATARCWTDWAGEVAVPAAESPLGLLPDVFQGVEVTPLEVRLIWNEKGDPESLRVALELLKSWSDQPPA